MRLLLQQPVEIIENARDQRLAARVLPGWGRGEESQQIARLLDRLRPAFGGRREEGFLELRLPGSERGLVVLDLDPPAPEFGRLLRRHAAMRIERGRSVRHA